jgi:hypothetical protein
MRASIYNAFPEAGVDALVEFMQEFERKNGEPRPAGGLPAVGTEVLQNGVCATCYFDWMTARADVRPEYSYSTRQLDHHGLHGAVHLAAVAAFWFFSWTNVLTAVFLHWLAVGFGISLGYHRLHTHRGYKTSKAFEYIPGDVRHADARGRADLLGGHPPRAPSAFRPRRRSAYAARRRVLGARRLDSVRRHPSQQHGADVEVRADLAADPSIAGSTRITTCRWSCSGSGCSPSAESRSSSGASGSASSSACTRPGS